MIWIIASAVLLIALVLLAWPFVRSGKETISRSESGLDIYRRQLQELDAEIDRGAVRTRETETMQVEIKRRMLRLGRQENTSVPTGKNGNKYVILAIIVLVPLASLGLYADLGSPGEPSRPLASRDIPAERAALQTGNADSLIQQLVDSLSKQPDNLEGWMLLARTLTEVGRYREAAETYMKATIVAPTTAGLYVGAGENFYFAADGNVDVKAKEAFDKALELAPDNPGARYYLALFAAQNGQEKEALGSWRKLYEESEADAPYMPVLKRRIKEVATRMNTELGDLFDRKPAVALPPGPSDKDIAAAANMSATDRQAMIQSMVEGLATRMVEAPDYDGLMRLGNSYGTLEDYDKSAEAYARAAALKPDDVAAMTGEAAAYIQGSDIGQPPPEKAVVLYRKVLTLNQDNLQALWYVGLAEATAGNNAAALKLWQKLQQLAPKGSSVETAAAEAIKNLSDEDKN